MSAFDVVQAFREVEGQPFAVEFDEVGDAYDVRFMAETEPISVTMWGSLFLNGELATEAPENWVGYVDKVVYVIDHNPGGANYFEVYLRDGETDRGFHVKRRREGLE